ncbi:MAG: hypothetical protein CME31_18740 [Gimesia sp.]|uniref:Uncharacterized protein n=1 Tax=Gimesia maris TaxID=122 RepID=A0A3D3R9D6_9PLAN|nr:hypothetical protein [Gimesia sp.]HCO24702.1 hypothetical protein [Gimesia maris]|tara:strand:- start:21487 stop:22431 length:945 start_codon:yes stop_codon:yes gene_type:complete
MNDQEKRDQISGDTFKASMWAGDCMSRISCITRHFQMIDKMFSKYEVFYGPDYPPDLRATKTIAVSHIRGLLERGILEKQDLKSSLMEYKKCNMASAVSHYEIANAYHLSTIEFKGAAITNSLNAVFVIGSFIESQVLGRINHLSTLWENSEINEDTIKDFASKILSVVKIASVVDENLMFQVAAQLRNETIRVKRWLLDVYGYGDYEPVLEDVYHVEYLSELMVISSKQIMELAREYKAGDPDDQPEYKSPWLAGHRKRHGWPEPDIQTGGGRGKQAIWSMDCILEHLTSSLPLVPDHRWGEVSYPLSDKHSE